MPILVPFEAVLGWSEQRRFWPQEFDAIIRVLDSTPNEKTTWLIAGDWLEEKLDEPDLAQAFRWIGRNRNAVVVKHPRMWGFEGHAPPIFGPGVKNDREYRRRMRWPNRAWREWDAVGEPHACFTLPTLALRTHKFLLSLPENMRGYCEASSTV
jgi:hypothetical protein